MTDDTPLPQATGEPTLVAARYALERSLGSGGMGEVFVARDRTLDREVAVPPSRSLVSGPAASRRLLSSAVRAGLVVPLVGLGAPDGAHVIYPLDRDVLV